MRAGEGRLGGGRLLRQSQLAEAQRLVQREGVGRMGRQKDGILDRDSMERREMEEVRSLEGQRERSSAFQRRPSKRNDEKEHQPLLPMPAPLLSSSLSSSSL
jgi:hypothetical protein